MKLYVKRDLNKFEKGKIEFNDVGEWSLILKGLNSLLESSDKDIEFYEGLLDNPNFERKKTKENIEQIIKEKAEIAEMIKALDHNNEIAWEREEK